VRRPSESERDALALVALERSGSEDVIEYPVPLAGFSVALCRLSAEHWRAYIDGAYKGDGRNARAQAIARARLWPPQGDVSAACQAIPKLAEHLAEQIERLHGAQSDCLRVVEVDANLDDSAVAELGIEPARLAALRKRYPNPKQLKIARYEDDELDIRWVVVLRVPNDMAHDMAKGSMRARGHEAAVTYLVNALAEPEGKAAEAFVAERPPVAACLFPTLLTWAETVAAERPTIWRRKSPASATSTAPQTSSPHASPGSSPKPPEQQGSS
jgi:hypothetical protein